MSHAPYSKARTLLRAVPRAQCGRSAMAVGFLRCFKRSFLFRCRFCLEALFPFGLLHAVDDFPRLVLAQYNSFFRGPLAVPIAETIATKAGQDHQLHVLHVGPRAKMLHQTAEHGGLDFCARGFVHDQPPMFTTILDRAPFTLTE